MASCRREREIIDYSQRDLALRRAHFRHERTSLYERLHTQGLGHKARIVTKGCRKISGVDRGKTYAPVVKFTSIRVMLETVAMQDLELHQMDVLTAFLHGDLDKNIV